MKIALRAAPTPQGLQNPFTDPGCSTTPNHPFFDMTQGHDRPRTGRRAGSPRLRSARPHRDQDWIRTPRLARRGSRLCAASLRQSNMANAPETRWGSAEGVPHMGLKKPTDPELSHRLGRRNVLGVAAGAGAGALLGLSAGTAAAAPRTTKARTPMIEGFTSRFAEVNGTRLHYVIGGQGAPWSCSPGGHAPGTSSTRSCRRLRGTTG